MGRSDSHAEPTVRFRGVLRTRLLPPRLRPGCLPREDLVQQVLAGLDGRLVVITAGPGWGKSTLLAQALARVERPWVWCSCDERMSGSRLLVSHLAAGLAEHAPGFGAGLEAHEAPEVAVAALCNEVVETMPDEIVLVLDDVHTILETPAGDALSLLIRHVPPNVHVALATRVELAMLPARLRAQGMLEIGEDALALSESEAADLVAGLGLALDAAAVGELHRRTEGWPTGLLLAAQFRTPLPTGQEGGVPFDYLAEEVFALQPDDVQRFLLETAVLDRFTPALAAAVTGQADARRAIATLRARHLFIVRLDAASDWYRYHALFLAFLRRRLAESDPARVSELDRRAAAAWRAAGEPEEAVRHYLRAGDLPAVVAALDSVAEEMLETVGGDTIAAWLDAIPPELWTDCPGLSLAQASLLFARSEYTRAYDAVVNALDDLLATGQHDRAAVALARLLRGMVAVGGQHDHGIAVAGRYLARIDGGAAMVPPIRVMLAGMYAQACRYSEAEAQLRAAVAADGENSPVTAAWAVVTDAFYVRHPRGESQSALVALDACIEELEQQAPGDKLNAMLFARGYRAMVLNDLGRHAEALAEAERLRDASERRGMAGLATPVVAWLRFEALAGMGRWPELAAETERMAPLFARLGGAVRAYLAQTAEVRLAAHRGDRDAVVAGVEACRAELTGHAAPFEQSMTLADLADAALDAGLAELAQTLARDARLAAELAAAPWAETRAALLGAAARGPGAGDRLLADALEMTRRSGLVDPWTGRERRRAGPLLARALTAGLCAPEALAGILAAGGPDLVADVAAAIPPGDGEARARLAAAQVPGVGSDLVGQAAPVAGRGSRSRGDPAPRAPLRIVTFGGLAVWRGDVRVPDAAFERRKARILLAVLLCAGGPVHRHRLIGLLWPQLSPERGTAALHSTLYALRRALEPGRRTGSSLLLADGPAYRLALTAEDEWDAAVFLDLARAALDEGTLAGLLQAEAASTGPFLPEWADAEWAQPLRTDIEETDRAVLERLAERLVDAGRPAEALGRCRRLLALEPEREGWHRALMRVYAEAGERALALRQYHACRALLRHRLGIEPCRETRDLYSALLRDELVPARLPTGGRTAR